MDLTPDELAAAESVAHLASPLALASRTIPAFRHRPHQKLLSDAIVDAQTGRGPRFIAVSVPPQYGKSTITSVAAPMWWMELHSYGLVPGGIVGLVSYEDSLAMSWSSMIRRHIAARPDVFETKLSPSSKAAGEWLNAQGGGVIAVGITGSIVGRSISLLVIDDPTKNMEQAQSEKHREMVWNFWQTVGVGRLQPWTIVMVCCTRWREDDLIGRLVSGDWEGDPQDWRYVRIPAVADEPNDPLGRAIGEPLIRPQSDQTLELAERELVKVKKSISTYAWNTLWQQNPVDPEGSIFLEKYWKFYGGDTVSGPEGKPIQLPKDFDNVVISWDMTFKDTKGSDMVVGQAWGRKGGDYYLLDQVRGRWGFNETCAQVHQLANRTRERYANATTILVEDKANGPAVIDNLRSRIGGLVEFPVNQYGSKLSRAWACQAFLMGGNLHIPAPSTTGWVRDYMKELSDFPNAAHDDQVDATTQALLWMQKFKREPGLLISGAGHPIPERALSNASKRDVWIPSRR